MRHLITLLLLTSLLPAAFAQPDCATAEEKKLYELIMTYRRSKKLAVIPYSSKLSRVAQVHVKDLAEHYDYDTRGDCNPHSWSDKGSWIPCCYTADHKQAACMWNKPKEIAGYGSNGFEIAFYSSDDADAAEALEGWKGSPGHHALIINSGTWNKITWKGLGIGIYGNYAVVWFGELEDPSLLTLCP